MSVVGRKVIADLRHAPIRAALVALAVLGGALVVAVAFGAAAILEREVPASYARTLPAAATFWFDRVDAELVDRIAARPEITSADARRVVYARAQVAPGEWRTLLVFGIDDFAHLRVSTFRYGGKAPDDGEVLVEQSALAVLHAREGSLLDVRGPSGRAAALRVVGIAVDRGIAPGSMEGLGYAYATRATLDRLGAGDHLDEVRVTIASNDPKEVARIVADAASWLAVVGRTPRRVAVERRKHFHEDQIREGTRALECVSLLVLLLAAAIGFNVLSALMARQRREVGIMKAIGASPGQVLLVYGAFVLVVVTAGVIAGTFAGAAGARAYAGFIGEQLNVEIVDVSIPLSVVALEIGCGVALPLAGGLLPIALAARAPALAALADAPPLVSARERRSSFRPAVLLAVRNAYRRPLRFAITLVALALGGAIFMTVLHGDASLRRAVDGALGTRGDDIQVRLARPAPAGSLETLARAVPGVARAEAWSFGRVALHLREPAVGSELYDLFAPPDDATIPRASPLEGRWPEAREDDAIVVNGAFRASSTALSVGSRLTLLAEGRSYELRVVGVVTELSEAALYTNARTFARMFGRDGHANALRIATRDAPDTVVARHLETALIDGGSIPTLVMTRSTYRELLLAHMGEVFGIFLIAALATVTLGALSLSASVGLSALERRRELGVLRALGASVVDVARVVLFEACAIVGASLVLALVSSIPLAILMNQWIAEGLYVGIPLTVAPEAIAAWIAIAIVVTLAASAIPTVQAMRAPVHDAIAYD